MTREFGSMSETLPDEPSAGSCKQVLVSIVVPVRNEEQHIRGTLRQLLEFDAEVIPYEILVVDGESTDRTRDIVREMQSRHPIIRLFSNGKRLSSAARNIAVRNARGDFIVIVDGH